MNIKQPPYIRSALALAVCIGLSGPVWAQSAASLALQRLCRTKAARALK